MSWRGLRCVAFVLGLSGLVPSGGRAQEAADSRAMTEAEETALARDQFEQGIRLARRRQWQEAADHFARALELRETPQIRYNLAESLVNLGRLVEAAEHLALLAQLPDAPESVRQSVTELKRDVDARIGRLTIEVRGSRPSARIALDGRDLPTALLGVETPVDPGRHVVRAIVDDVVVDTAEVLVPNGGTAVASVTVPGAAPVESAAPVSDAPLAGEDDSGPRLGWLWATLAVGAVAAGVVVLVLVLTAPSPTAGNFTPGVIELD